MAAATAIAAIGLVSGGVQMFQQNKQKKDAQKRADSARRSAMGVTEANPFEGLQAPDVSKIAFDEASQSQAEALNTVKQSGEAGAAQVTAILKNTQDQKIRAAEKQAKQNYNRDLTQAQAQSNIEGRRAKREGDMYAAQELAATTAATQAQENMVAAGTGMMESATALGSGLNSDLEDGNLFGDAKPE